MFFKQQLKRIVLQILLLLLCFFITRSIFTLINYSRFNGLQLGEYLGIAFRSMRFDISAILAVNGLYIILFLLTLPIWRMRWWEMVTQVVFVVSNSVAFAFEISDWVYFPYNLKRATAEVLNAVSNKGDFASLLPGFIRDYWYVLLALIGMVCLIIMANRKIVRATPLNYPPARSKVSIFFTQLLILLLVGGASIVGIRGGLQRVPINLRNAVQAADVKYTPLVLNTPFSIINTIWSEGVEEVHYMPDNELTKYINPVKQYNSHPFNKKNVCIIILESFSRNFTCLNGGASYTPFLDSLMPHALTCKYAFANALRSAEAIPAILASIPNMTQEPFTTSLYGTDRITGLPELLKTKGYTSAFYHGATNGSMSFDIFSIKAGFDKYYGRTEYNNEKDYDGNWGIWDERFLQYAAKGINQMQQPFVTSIFTINSHPPYSVPPEYKDAFPKGTSPIHQCVGYSDMAVRKFFETASKQPWFNNTLFVITADHKAANVEPFEYAMDAYSIPVIFYAPGDSTVKGYYEDVVQELDIMPSVLDYVGYDKPFYSLGNSIFSPAKRYVVNAQDGQHLWVMDRMVLTTLALNPVTLQKFPYEEGRENLLDKNKQQADSSLLYLKAFIQTYNNAIIHDKLTLEQ